MNVEVILDVRDCTGPASTQGELAALWGKVERVLVGHPIQDSEVSDRSFGKVGVKLVARAQGVWTSQTVVAIQGVLQRAAPGRRCEVCLEDGVEPSRFAPFTCRCQACHRACSPTLLCEVHAVLPSGGEGAFHPNHAPRCPQCRALATFWCDGDCANAWCDAHRRTLPSLPDYAYCERCYRKRFPSCTATGCMNLGALRCEHVTSPSGDAQCGRWVCSIHGIRWQVYGKGHAEAGNARNVAWEGLARCPLHKDIPSLSQSEILRQIVYGTVSRQLRIGGRGQPPATFPRLPRLRAMNYVYRNARQSSPSYPDLYAAFVNAALVTSDTRQGRLLKERLQEHLTRLSDELEEWKRNTKAVRDTLCTLLYAAGHADLAAAIEITDFKLDRESGRKLAFWRLPMALKARFTGRERLSRQLGVTLLEDEGMR